MPNYRHRSDKNANAIINAINGLGGSAYRINSSGGRKNGLPDLVVGAYGKTTLVEIKSDDNELSEDQKEWHRLWRGEPIWVLRNLEDVYAMVISMKPKERVAERIEPKEP